MRRGHVLLETNPQKIWLCPFGFHRLNSIFLNIKISVFFFLLMMQIQPMALCM